LELEQIDLARPEPFIAAECGKSGINLGQTCASCPERFEVDVAELVESSALSRDRKQTLVGMLPMQIDHVRGDLGKRRDRRRAAVDVRPRAAVGWDNPTKNSLVPVGTDESTLDPSFCGAMTDARRIGAPADEEFDRLDEHRLAGTRFARQRRESRTKDEVKVFDHAKILDVEFAEHFPSFKHDLLHANVAA